MQEEYAARIETTPSGNGLIWYRVELQDCYGRTITVNKREITGSGYALGEAFAAAVTRFKRARQEVAA